MFHSPFAISPTSAMTPVDLRVPYLRKLSLQHTWMLGLLVADLMGMAIAWKGAELLAFRDPAAFVKIWSLSPDVGLFWVAVLVQIMLGTAAGLYRYGDAWRDVGKQLRTTALVFLTVLLVAFLYRSADGLPRSLFVIAWIETTAITLINRWFVHRTIIWLWHKNRATVPVMLFAHSDEIPAIRQQWQLRSGYRVVDVVEIPRRSRRSDRLPLPANQPISSQAASPQAASTHLPLSSAASTTSSPQPGVLTTPPHLLWQTIQDRQIQELHVSESCYRRMSPAELWQLRGIGKTLRILPPGLQPKHPSARSRSISGIQTTEFAPPILSGVDFALKRAFDICAATVLSILLSPVFLVIALWIRLDSAGPIIFQQQRVGLHDRPFSIFKFRTMAIDAEAKQASLEAENDSPDGILFKMKGDPRITKAGAWLRRTSLDELPQLWNVLRGEMSLVGPRPLPLRDVGRFKPWHHARHHVLPGITGLWQVRGRSMVLDFEDAMKLDLEYIQQWSLWLDIRLLLETIGIVLTGKGAH